MRSPIEWDETDLDKIVLQKEQETIALEFKASPALDNGDKNKHEIVKDVSAMANSAGGAIVYGITEQAGRAASIDSGRGASERKSDWLESIVASIQPRIDGVRVRAIPLVSRSAQTEALVITVPQSTRAPHQARDHKYYKRHGTHAVPMEDYEVRDVARRSVAPELRAHVAILLGASPPAGAAPGTQLAAVSLENHSDTPAEYALLEVWVDERLAPDWPGLARHGTCIGNRKRGLAVRYMRVHWNGRSSMPVFKGARVPVSTHPMRLSVQADGTYLMRWRVKAPMMKPAHGHVLVTWSAATLELKYLDLTDDEMVEQGELPWTDTCGAGSQDDDSYVLG